MNYIFPPKLTKDTYIALVAPADSVAGVMSDKQIQAGIDYLENKGYKVLKGKSLGEKAVGHTASIQACVDDIHEMFEREDVGCIMAFWGGFNSNRLLESLDYDLIKNNPKIFIGYSDITALTAAITTKTGLVTFSGPGGISFVKPEPFDYTWEYFEKMCIEGGETDIVSSQEYADDLYFLREGDDDHRIKQKNEGLKVFREGVAEGRVVAGNLQTLLVLSGTEYQANMKDTIIFLEEDETCTPALFDRFMTQARQIGWFDDAAGLVVGRFTEQSGFTKEDSLEMVLERVLDGKDMPVMYNADFGHSDPMFTIAHGGEVRIDTKEKIISFKQAVS